MLGTSEEAKTKVDEDDAIVEELQPKPSAVQETTSVLPVGTPNTGKEGDGDCDLTGPCHDLNIDPAHLLLHNFII